MESSTTILGMIRGNVIYVPDYQRAYSWEISNSKSERRQVDTFLNDLQDYLKSNVKTPYYFGHFLFEKKEGDTFAIIDGQQRLTTITIFIAALFFSIKSERELSKGERIIYDDMIERYGEYHFATVGYDKQLFYDYVIDGRKKDHNGIETTSGQRIVKAYDFFVGRLSQLPIQERETYLQAVVNATCTTHIVNGEAEAIQMFIFQNDRGKKPSNLEVIKAHFMYHIHIYGNNQKKVLMPEITERFENIYRFISSIEDFVSEDDVLTHTMKVYFNSLWEDNPLERVNNELAKPSQIDFIKNFSFALENSFQRICQLKKDRELNVNIEGSLLCRRYDIVLPFYIKAYNNDMPAAEINRMSKVIGDIVLRDAIIKTRADLRSRLNDLFQKIEKSSDDITNRIEYMKQTTDWWWAYWNNDSLKNAIEGNWNSNYHWIAKIILWKYENYLIETEGKSGYASICYNSIKDPHLEHIAPQTEKDSEQIATGYDTYDDDFKEHYLYSIGNFLLLSAPHNESIGNKPFEKKRVTYDQLRQQREIQKMTESDHIWNREKIQKRKDKIITFVLENL